MIAVVCVYNNKNVYAGHLLKSLQAQSVAFELIALDNTAGRFSSAAQALNFGARQIKSGSTYIMFVHQDVELRSAAFLEDMEAQLDGLPGLGIAGVAGNSRQANRIISNITHSSPPRNAGEKLETAVEAMTVDECCALVPRQVFEKHAFDEAVCDNWHAYVVEYCLRVKAAGLAVYIVPACLHHGSVGSLNSAYFKTLEKVVHAHGKTYSEIYTTCGCWRTGLPVFPQRCWHHMKNFFYAATNPLAAWGVIPQWILNRIKRKRLMRNQ